MTDLKRLALPLALLVGLAFLIFMANQISGVYLMVRENAPVLANILLVVMIGVSLGLVCWPLLLYLKLPRPLIVPQDPEALPAYQARVLRRLQRNSLLKKEGLIPRKVEEVPGALEKLRAESKKIIRQTANMVFLSTAVSQNGKLDALTVLATQVRMVWKIAHLYYQRPTLRELIYLYANVGGSSFLASEIEDLDVSRQVEPVIRSFLQNSAGKSIPVIGPTAHIVLDSLLEGSTNAFLTLRVGNLAIGYCGIFDVADKKKLKTNAFREAAVDLREIVMKSSAQIVTGLIKATKNAGLDTLKSGWEGLKTAGSRVTGGLVKGGQKLNPFKPRKRPESSS